LRRKKLLESAEYFRQALKNKGLQVKGCSQIVPVIVKDNFKAVGMAKSLQEKGYWVLPIRPPTVPENEARIRFSLSFHHDKKILQKLIEDIDAINLL
jgi:8-amino-7-oxononanoate synthase